VIQKLLFFAMLCLNSLFICPQDAHRTYEYLLNNYIEVCHISDQSKKIEELNILLIECKAYKQGLPVIPSPSWSLLMSAIWVSLAANRLEKKDLLFYCYSLPAFYYSSWLLLDLYRFRRKDEIIQQYAQLESLIAGIEKRLKPVA
jgi:hypothetical protein